MNRADVIELFIEIKQEYPFFDDSDSNIDRYLDYLADVPFAMAMASTKEYIRTQHKREPGIADIRGRFDDERRAQRSKDAATAHFANLDAWGAADKPPPPDYWERGRRLIRGEADA